MQEPTTRVQVCGALSVVWNGVPVEPPGRQGRLLFAFLLLNRPRACRRDELIAAVWEREAPGAGGDALLSPPLSRLRKTLGPGALRGRSELELVLPAGASVDWDDAHAARDCTLAALRSDDAAAAIIAAREALAIARGGLLPGLEGDWIDEFRRELADLRVEMLEAVATCGVRLGGVDLTDAEQAGRAAIEAAPFRESSYAALMQVLRARGNVAEALRVYEEIRTRLRDELGTSPGSTLLALHNELLAEPAAAPGPAAPPSPSPLAARISPSPPAASDTTMIERDAELNALDGVLERAATSGEGRAVLIEGPAGIGKSELLLEARRRAAERGLLTLSARGSELERDFPFGVVRQLFEALVADPTRSDALFAGAASPAAAVFGALDDPADSASGDASFAALHGLFWLTLNLTADGPVVLAIDDLQWCDLASLRFIAYLTRRLEGVGVTVVATVRTGEAATDTALMADITEDSAAAAVRPQPLTGEGVRRLVVDRLGDGAAPAFCDAVAQVTAGNPLLVGQLVTALAADGVEPTAESVDMVREIGPRAVSRSVLTRLGRLSGETIAAARAIAVLGESAELPSVAALAELDERAAAQAASSLARAELLRPEPPFGFVHPLVRDAVYHDLPAAEREFQHARAARVLADLGAPSDEVSTHLLAIPRRGEEWIARTLHDAGLSARRRGAADSAVTYLRRALDEPRRRMSACGCCSTSATPRACATRRRRSSICARRTGWRPIPSSGRAPRRPPGGR